jgi:hypothetical protein
MRTLISALLVLVMSLCVEMTQAQNFEGIITMTRHDQNPPKQTIFQVKGHLVLVSFQAKSGPVRVINDNDSGITTSLFEKNGKKYAYVSRVAERGSPELDDRQKMIFELAQEQVSMQVTTETRKIGKYTCFKINGEDPKNLIEAWVTHDIHLSLFDLFPSQQSPESDSINVQKKIWKEGFVLEYWTKNKKSGEVAEVTFDIAEQPVPDDVFTYSHDEYYEFDQNTLNQLYTESAKDPQKMEELKSLLEAFKNN